MKELSKARMLDILKTRETCAFCPHVLEDGSCLSCDRVLPIAFDELRCYYRQLEEILQRQEEEPEQLQSEQGECQTLLHEILHGIANHFGLAINEEESTIDKLASGLYMVMKDNPEMFTV